MSDCPSRFFLVLCKHMCSRHPVSCVSINMSFLLPPPKLDPMCFCITRCLLSCYASWSCLCICFAIPVRCTLSVSRSRMLLANESNTWRTFCSCVVFAVTTSVLPSLRILAGWFLVSVRLEFPLRQSAPATRRATHSLIKRLL